MCFIYCCIKLYELSELLMHLLLSLPTLLCLYTLLGLGSNNRLALLRPITVSDFLSPAIVGGYWNTLAM
jgi:hypothetical protein